MRIHSRSKTTCRRLNRIARDRSTTSYPSIKSKSRCRHRALTYDSRGRKFEYQLEGSNVNRLVSTRGLNRSRDRGSSDWGLFTAAPTTPADCDQSCESTDEQPCSPGQRDGTFSQRRDTEARIKGEARDVVRGRLGCVGIAGEHCI